MAKKKLSILSKMVKTKTEATLGEQLGSSVVDWTKRGASGLLNMLNPTKAASSMVKSKNPWFSKIGSGRITAIKSNDSIADVLTKIYNFLEQTHHEDVIARELEVAARKEELEENGVRHKKMLEALRSSISHKKEEKQEKPEKEKGTLAGFIGSIVSGIFSLVKGIFSGIMLAFNLVSLGIGTMMTAISAIGTLVGVIFSLAKTLKILSLLFSTGGFNILKAILLSPVAIPLAVVGAAAIALDQSLESDRAATKADPNRRATSLKSRATRLDENTFNPNKPKNEDSRKPTDKIADWFTSFPEKRRQENSFENTAIRENKEVKEKRLNEYNRNLGLAGKKPVDENNPNFLEYLKTFPDDKLNKVVTDKPTAIPAKPTEEPKTTPTAIPAKPTEEPKTTPTAIPATPTGTPTEATTAVPAKTQDAPVAVPAKATESLPKPQADAQSLTKPIPELTDPVIAASKQNQTVISTTNTKNNIFGKPSKTQYTAIPQVRDMELYSYCFSNAPKV